MGDCHNSYQEPDVHTDPWDGTTGYWTSQPSVDEMGSTIGPPGAPSGNIFAGQGSFRSHPYAARRNGQLEFQHVLSGSRQSQQNHFDYTSSHGLDKQGFTPVDRNAAQDSYVIHGSPHEAPWQHMNASKYSTRDGSCLALGGEWPYVPLNGGSSTYLQYPAGVDEDFRQIAAQSRVSDTRGLTEQAICPGIVPIASSPGPDSEYQWIYDRPQSGASSTTAPWSQYARPTMRPYLAWFNHSHVGYGQIPEHILGRANGPPVGTNHGKRATDCDQNVTFSPNEAQGCIFTPATTAAQALGRFVDREVADHSSSEEAGSPDTGSQEIVFDLQSGETVNMKERRVVPEDQRAQSLWIRKNGGSCAACKRGKRKCEPSHIEGRSPTTQASSPSTVSGQTSPWVVVKRQTSSSTKRAREGAHGPSFSPLDTGRYPLDAGPRPMNSSTFTTVLGHGRAAKRPRTRARIPSAAPDSASLALAGVPDYSMMSHATSRGSPPLEFPDLPQKATFSEVDPGLGAQFTTRMTAD